MKVRLRNTAPIPPLWSPDEAIAVIDFLQDVIDSIWLMHGDAIDRALVARQQAQSELALDDTTAAEPEA